MWATAARAGFVLLKNKKTRRLLLVAAGVLLLLAFLLIATGVSMMATLFGMCQQQAEEISSSNAPSSAPSRQALSDIPEDFLEEYREQAEKYGIDWALLAAVGKQESNHGQDYSGCATSEDGARGPLQFIPSTWASEGVDGDGDGTKDPCDTEDAIASGASYLANLGAAEDPRGALCSYYGACADANADYADEVLAQAEAYRGAAQEGSGESESTSLGSTSADPGGESGSGLAFLPPLMSAAHAQSAESTPAGWSLVEPDKTMTYWSETRFDSYLEAAVEEWNALGGVEIEPAASEEEANVVVFDGDSLPASWAMGFTKTTDAAANQGTIEINEQRVAEVATETNRKAVMVHELGHALGFVHQNDKESVMNQDLNTDVPTEMDVRIYQQTWGGSGSPANADPADSYGEEQTSEECGGLGPLTRLLPGVG